MFVSCPVQAQNRAIDPGEDGATPQTLLVMHGSMLRTRTSRFLHTA